MIYLFILRLTDSIFYEFSKSEISGRIIKMKVYKKLGLLFVLWRIRFLNIRQVICKIASRRDLKSQDFSNLHFWGKLGPIFFFF